MVTAVVAGAVAHQLLGASSASTPGNPTSTFGLPAIAEDMVRLAVGRGEAPARASDHL